MAIKKRVNRRTKNDKPERVVLSPPKRGKITRAMVRKAIIEIAQSREKKRREKL